VEAVVTAIRGAIVLVTGGGRGIGKMLVEELYARGAGKVYATARDPRTVTHPGAVPLALEVTDPASVTAAAEQAQDVTILINNAGASVRASYLDSPMEDVRRDLDTNFYGPLLVTRAFAPIIERNGGGHILNVHSALSWLADGTPYSASKAALWSQTNSLRCNAHSLASGRSTQNPSAVRSLGPGDACVVDGSGSEGAVASGVVAAELGEESASGVGLCCSASSWSREPRRSARPVMTEGSLGDAVVEGPGLGLTLGTDPPSWPAPFNWSRTSRPQAPTQPGRHGIDQAGQRAGKLAIPGIHGYGSRLSPPKILSPAWSWPEPASQASWTGIPAAAR
jgi:NADP-dependent 3-hydroxy acid dehydrogenase YdfG